MSAAPNMVGAGPSAPAARVPLVLAPIWGPGGPKSALRLAGAAPNSLPGGGPPCGSSQPFAPILPAGKAARPPRTVLHLRASNFVGGPERQILRYCTAAAGGPRQIVASFTRGDAAGGGGEGWAWLRAARQQGVEAYALPGGGWRDLAAAGALARLVEEQQVELICAHGYRADLLGSWVGRRRGIPCAWFLRGWTGENGKVRLYEALDRGLLPLAERVVCLSERQAAEVAGRIPAARVRVVVNALAAPAVERAGARAALRARYGLRSDALVIAIAGRLSPEKGAADFLRAAARLRRERAEARFLVFGEGPLRPQLEAQSAGLGLGGCLQFAGHVAEWTQLLPGLDLLVNPSRAEQAPNVVLEAMAAGVAVVATAVGSVAEIAGAPASLELVAAGDAVALARAMQALAEQPERRRELGQAGQARVRAAYSPERQQGQLQALYAELLPAAAAGGGREAEAEWPRVSVVLPVRHEARHLGALLEQLLAQDYPAERYEILVADGGAGEADDGTTELAQDYAQRYPGRVRWVANPGRRSAAGRNCGVRAAQGEWIVFVDGHCQLPGPGWLAGQMAEAQRTGARCLSRPQPLTAGMLVGAGPSAPAARVPLVSRPAVTARGGMLAPTWGPRGPKSALRLAGAAPNSLAGGGPPCGISQPFAPILPAGKAARPPRAGGWQAVIAHARASRIGHGADSTIYDDGARGWVNPSSSGAAYQRSLFDQVGLYDESFDACEDVEFNHRVAQAGVQAWLCPEGVVYYAARSSLGGLWRQLERYGRGRVRLARRHSDARSLAQWVPAAWLAGLPLALAAAVWATGWLRAASLGALLLYAALVAVSALRLGGRHGWRHLLGAPLVYATIHAALGWGAWRELISGAPAARPTAPAPAGALPQESSSRSSL